MILDVSTLLTLLQDESGFRKVLEALDDGSIGGANLSEVAAKLIQSGVSERNVVVALKRFDLMSFQLMKRLRSSPVRSSNESASLALVIVFALQRQSRAHIRRDIGGN